VKIPSSFLQNDVVIALAIAMPAGQNNGITFPLIEGKLTEVHDDCVVLSTSKGDVMCIPDTRIQHVIKASKIARPDTGLVDASGAPV
jgi:hypothetical protein